VLGLLTAAKLIAEIALMALLGQGLLALLAGRQRDRNLFYQLLQVLTRPFTAAARALAPRQVADRHLGFVAFFLLAILWCVVTFEKVRYCVRVGVALCQ
jgi:hypothetical protein